MKGSFRVTAQVLESYGKDSEDSESFTPPPLKGKG